MTTPAPPDPLRSPTADLVERCLARAGGSAVNLAAAIGTNISQIGRWRKGGGMRAVSMRKLMEYEQCRSSAST